MFDFIIKAIEKATREAVERNRAATGASPPYDPRLQGGVDVSQHAAAQAPRPPKPKAPKTPKAKKSSDRPPPLRQRVQSQAAAARGDARRPASANARTIANWARPRSLRAQFILTEILKPPLSMREPR